MASKAAWSASVPQNSRTYFIGSPPSNTTNEHAPKSTSTQRRRLLSAPDRLPQQSHDLAPGERIADPIDPPALRLGDLGLVAGAELAGIGDQVLQFQERNRVLPGDLFEQCRGALLHAGTLRPAERQWPGVFGPHPFRVDHDPAPAEDGAAEHVRLLAKRARHRGDVVVGVDPTAATRLRRDPDFIGSM